MFDDVTGELSANINNVIQRTVSLDEELKKATDNIYKELENKLDRAELDALKEYIERTLRKLKRMHVSLIHESKCCLMRNFFKNFL
jgi:hypothetical protein